MSLGETQITKNRKKLIQKRNKTRAKKVLAPGYGDMQLATAIMYTLEGGESDKEKKGFLDNLFDVAELSMIFGKYETFVMKISNATNSTSDFMAKYHFVKARCACEKNWRRHIMATPHFISFVESKCPEAFCAVTFFKNLFDLMEFRKEKGKSHK